MINKRQNIDDLFRDALSGFEAEPDGSAWDNISERLADKGKSRILPVILWAAAGIAVMATLGVALYLTLSAGNTRDGLPQSTGIIAETPALDLTETDKEETLKGNNTTSVLIENNTESGKQQTPISSLNDFSGKTSPGDEPTGIYTFTPAGESNSGVYSIAAEEENTGRTVKDDNYLNPLDPRIPHIFSGQDLNAKTMQAYEVFPAADINIPGELATTSGRNGKWILGGEFAPVYTYRHISSGYLDDKIIDKYNSAETGMVSYSGGMNISWAVSGRLELQSGLQYSKYGQVNENAVFLSYHELNTNINSIYNRIIASNSTGQISKDGSRGGDIYTDGVDFMTNPSGYENWQNARQIFEYLELPLVIKYKFIEGKVDLHINGGIITNLMIGNRVYLDNDGNEIYIGRTEMIREINYLGLVGIGVEYPVAGNFDFTLEPRFRYYINSFDETGRINVHPYAFGVYAGLRYSFR